MNLVFAFASQRRAMEVAASLETVTVTRFETVEMADGSRRVATFVDVSDHGAAEDYRMRVCSPAPTDAPQWAKDEHSSWTVERVDY
jgi:hypothetical protein